jgi:SseB protein N-terminal domain
MGGSDGHDGGVPETELDRALAAAGASDDRAEAFYDAFLNARLYVPTERDDTDLPADTVSLLVADIEGEGIVPVFDSEARLAAWAEEPVPFTVLPGHALVAQLDPELSVALNVGTEHFKLFVDDELAWLRERLEETVADLASRNTAELIEFGDAAPPAALAEALLPALARNADVGAAFLVEAKSAEAGKTRRFVLVLDVGDAGDALFAEVARDVGIAARRALGGDEVMDIIAFNPVEGTGRALIERAVMPIFARTSEALH